jgi:hypothetical protein
MAPEAAPPVMRVCHFTKDRVELCPSSSYPPRHETWKAPGPALGLHRRGRL